MKKARPRFEHQSNTQPQLLPQRQQHQQPNHGYSHSSKGSVRNYINGSYGANNSDDSLKAKKIFVGGLSADLTEEIGRAHV